MTTFATQATVALEEATRLAEHGYALTPVTITRAASGKKQARFHRGWRHENAWSSDPDQIRAWWVDHPDTSFAIGCAVNGIEGVDLDVKPGEGIDSVSWWAERSLPMGRLCQDTPSGGRHTIWAVRRDGRSLPQEAGKTLGRGIDTRNRSGLFFAAGAYVLGEPGNYTIAGELPRRDQLTTTPDEVLDLFAAAAQQEREQRPADGRIVVHQLEWQQRMVAAALDAIRNHPREEGGYRKKLQHAALFLGRIVEQQMLSLGEATSLLTRAHMAVWGPSLWPENVKDIRDGLADGPALERWRAPESVESTPEAERQPVDDIPGVEEPPREDEPVGQSGEPGEPGGEPTTAEEFAARVFEREVDHKLRQLRVAQTARDRLALELAPPSALPGSTSLRDLLLEEPSATKYRIEGMWPTGGKVLVTAPKKSGKTTMMGNVVRCLTDGDAFLSKPYAPGDWRAQGAGFAVHQPEHKRVTFVADFEMTRDMSREWLADQRIQAAEFVHIEFMRGRTWDLRDDKVRAQWAAYLRSLNVGTLIVDPIGPVLSRLSLDENDNGHVGMFLGFIDALVNEAGIDEHLVVHHAGKGDGQDARGASAFTGWCDAWWQITRNDEGSFIRAEGRDVDLHETALVFDRTTRRLSLGEGNRVESRTTGDVEAAVKAVEASPGMSRNNAQNDVRDELGCGTERARAALVAAVKAGRVHRHAGPSRSFLHFPGANCQACP